MNIQRTSCSRDARGSNGWRIPLLIISGFVSLIVVASRRLAQGVRWICIARARLRASRYGARLIASIICTVPIRERSWRNPQTWSRVRYQPGIRSGERVLALASRFSKLAATCNNTVQVEPVHKVRVDPRYIKREYELICKIMAATTSAIERSQELSSRSYEYISVKIILTEARFLSSFFQSIY